MITPSWLVLLWMHYDTLTDSYLVNDMTNSTETWQKVPELELPGKSYHVGGIKKCKHCFCYWEIHDCRFR